MTAPTAFAPDAVPARIAAIDIARTIALVGMAVFHFVYDLEMFGFAPPGTSTSPGWFGFARTVAGSFLFIAGMSLMFAHARGLRWRPFLRRLGILVLAAGAISVATYLAFPDRYVFFGILHAIALFSVVGLAFLRLPALVTAALAAAVWFGAPALKSPAFDHPLLAWLGLSTVPPLTVDFEPFFPWFGAFLLGIAAARAALSTGIAATLADAIPGHTPLARALAWPGRHSLAIYLLHQPVLIGLVYLATLALR